MDFSLEETLPVDPRKVDRIASPVTKAWDIAYLRFAKPDLNEQAAFFKDFGFIIAEQTDERLMCAVPGQAPISSSSKKRLKQPIWGWVSR
ncbi:MAG: hypothetical protein CMI60_20530 [Parvibaculum sp.]|nr:hypothetical protein [Parvibaculum sp.]